jgi:magnesium-protoporphyrin O-methyltransferase
VLTLQELVDLRDRSAASDAQSLFQSREKTENAERVQKYFEASGFSRWAAIYGQGDIPPIWRVIRDGHDRAIDLVVDWVGTADGDQTVLDAGCGTGNLATRLADSGHRVQGFDLSAPMVSFARHITQGRISRGPQPEFFVGDISALDGQGVSYDTVCCLDVLFHYPYEEVKDMLARLAALSRHKVVGSFAIRTTMNAFWMEIGQRFFHKKNRMTKLHLLTYDQVEQIMYRSGFAIKRTERVTKFFYDSYVFEAVRR